MIKMNSCGRKVIFLQNEMLTLNCRDVHEAELFSETDIMKVKCSDRTAYCNGKSTAWNLISIFLYK